MKPITILIADDVAEVRASLRSLLPLAGESSGLVLEVVGEAANGSEAIEQAIVLEPDVVLMDLEMPQVDGYSAARTLKSRRAGIRIIALTVHGDPTSRRMAQEAGIDGFVEKGAPMADLMAAIRGPISQA